MLNIKKLNTKKIIGSVVILVLFIVFLMTGYFLSKPSKEIDSKAVFKENTTVESKESKTITVYINGEVKNPGVYKLKSDSRIEELVKQAGGTKDSADITKLNFAKKLKDEDYIYIDKKIDGKAATNLNSSGRGVSQDGKVNLNTASKEELKTVQGIGDVTAQKIIDYREKNGSFSSLEDLKKVGRIGDKTLERIKDKLEVR